MSYVCAYQASKKTLLNGSKPFFTRQCLWRAYFTSDNHPKIPPPKQDAKSRREINSVDLPDEAGRQCHIFKRPPSRSVENGFLQSIFQGSGRDERIHSRRQEVSGEQSNRLNEPSLPPEPGHIATRSEIVDLTFTNSQPWPSSTSRNKHRARPAKMDSTRNNLEAKSPVDKTPRSSLTSSTSSLDASLYGLTSSQPGRVSPAQAKAIFGALEEDGSYSSGRVVDLVPASTPSHQSRRPEVPPYAVVEKIVSRIGKATEKHDVSRIEVLWTEAQEFMESMSTASDTTGSLSHLYAQFLLGYMSVHRPNRAIQIWNEMIKNDIQPTVQMWDTMLNGFGKVRNASGVQDIWEMMLSSGFKPDGRLWVTRIRALSASESWDLSAQAFEEMMISWLRAVKSLNQMGRQLDLASIGDVDQSPKPTIDALNALVSGLVRFRKQKHLMQALSWAQTLGIDMDSHTFNPIIRMALKDGDGPLVNKILSKMHGLGINRDIATYTMILRALFQRDRVAAQHTNVSVLEASAPGEAINEKLDAAASILEEIEGLGLEANAYTFSTLISGLLNDRDPNLEAASAIRMYMVKKNIELSSQIYTSFITAHFARNEGHDVARVMLEWERARGDRNIVLDDIFYDRLIEGFAKCGEIRRMKSALAQAGKSRHVPGWIALTEAITALAKTEDWASVEDILQDVRAEEQDLDRVRKGKGKKAFWDAVRAMGLGDGEAPRVIEDTANDGIGVLEETRPRDGIINGAPTRRHVEFEQDVRK